MTIKIPYQRVGQTTLEVPRIGLGTAHINKHGEAVSIVHKALELGINFFDTAPLYQTEQQLGLALRGVPRDSYTLATKVGRLPDGDGGFLFDYSPDGIKRSIDNSLSALQLDRIDILHIHDPDDHYEQALHQAFPTLAELRRQGVIKAIGAGMNQWEMLVRFAQDADFDCFLLAGRYTLLEQRSLEGLKIIREKNISVFAGGVYNSGILATGATENATYNYLTAPSEIMAKAKQLEAVCTRYNVPLNAAAVQFIWAHPAYTSLVIGADRAAQVEENLQTLEVEIPAAFWQELISEGLIEAGAPLPEGI